MLYRISVAERGLTGIANIFRSRLSRLDDLLRAGTVPLTATNFHATGRTKFSNLCTNCFSKANGQTNHVTPINF